MLTDILKPRIVELGSIRIGKKGAERVSSNNATFRLPMKLDHFLITKLTRDENDDMALDKPLMEALALEGYADADGMLRRIPIRVLSNDPEEVMQANYCWYHKAKLAGISDGHTVTLHLGADSDNWLKPLEPPMQFKHSPDILEWKDGRGDKLFKIHTIFNCVIASRSARFGGVYKFRTSSGITGSQLFGGLLHILELTNGILVNMPLQLVIRPLQVSPAVMKGKSTKVYVVHVELVGDDLKALQQQAIDQARWMVESAGTARKMLSAYRRVLRSPGDEIDPAELADIQQEFHPEGNTDREAEFPMPKAISAAPETPADTGIEHETNDEPPPPAPAPAQTPAPAPAPAPAPTTAPPAAPAAPTDKKRAAAQQRAEQMKAMISEAATIEEVQQIIAVGGNFHKWYKAMKKDGFADIIDQLDQWLKIRKRSFLVTEIENLFTDTGMTMEKATEIAHAIGIKDPNTADNTQLTAWIQAIHAHTADQDGSHKPD